MKKIFKYRIPMEDEFVVELPWMYHVLDVQVQDGMPVMWLMVWPDTETVKRRFRLFATGVELPSDLKWFDHKGTFQVSGGSLVFHLFDVGNVHESEEQLL